MTKLTKTLIQTNPCNDKNVVYSQYYAPQSIITPSLLYDKLNGDDVTKNVLNVQGALWM